MPINGFISCYKSSVVYCTLYKGHFYIFLPVFHTQLVVPPMVFIFHRKPKEIHKQNNIWIFFFKYKCCFFKWKILKGVNGDLMKMQNLETEWIFFPFAHSFHGITEPTWQNEEILSTTRGVFTASPCSGHSIFPLDPLGMAPPTSHIPHSASH